MHNWKAGKKLNPKNVKDKLDQWLLLQLHKTIKNVTKAFDAYNLPNVIKEYRLFVAELSRWYIRRSRERFNNNDEGALSTLYFVLVEFSKLIAPIAPFLSEELYQNLVITQDKNGLESVHLADFPIYDKEFLKINEAILEKMSFVRSVVELGQSVRVNSGLRVRQALAELQVKAKKVKLEDWMTNLIKEELNVKKVEIVAKLISADKWVVAESDDQKLEISLDTNLTPELISEGIYREIVRGIQNLRKQNGLSFGDKIFLDYKTADDLVHKTVISKIENLGKDIFATAIKYNEKDLQWDATLKINGSDLYVKFTIIDG
jgi:isoleucyl-tRNA synthetase